MTASPDAEARAPPGGGRRPRRRRHLRAADDDLGRRLEPGRLDRAHVVAHLARDADALINMLTRARTGVETTMCPSREVRDAGLAATAALQRHRDDARPPLDGRRCATKGVPLPPSVVPWMGAREVGERRHRIEGPLDAIAARLTRSVSQG